MDWKSDPDLIFKLFGIKTAHVVAGISGGLTRYVFVGGGLVSGIVSVIMGLMITLNASPSVYFVLTRQFPNYADPTTEHAIVYFVGMTGWLLCEGIFKLAKNWRDNPYIPGLPKRPDDQKPPGG